MAANIQPIACVSGFGTYATGPMVPNQVEAASQTFKKGSLVIWVSGAITIAATNVTSGLVGIPTAPASGITSNPVGVIPILPSYLYEISIDGALSTNAPGTGSLAQSNVGSTYGVSLDANTGLFYLDTANANKCVRLVGFQTNANTGSSDAGVINGRALVAFLGDTSVWTAAT